MKVSKAVHLLLDYHKRAPKKYTARAWGLGDCFPRISHLYFQLRVQRSMRGAVRLFITA